MTEDLLLELPAELLAQLSCMPEEPPTDFECAICARAVSNRFNCSPAHYERPPICMSCESISGYSWTGSAMRRTKPTGGSFRDKRNAIRIAALADAIDQEASTRNWRAQHGRA